MIGKREEIPYDEDGKQLSFSTDAETVYVDGVPLKTWLSRLETKLSGIAAGKDGNSFYDFQTEYAAVSDENNNLEAVKQITYWESSSPVLTLDRPHLWKKIQSRIKDPSGTISVTNIDYQYCGSLGQTGLDAEWKEWIFRIMANEGSEIETALTLQSDLDSYYSADKGSIFQQNDFIPPLWDDDMHTVTDEQSVQWCASRYKKDGIWSKFSNVHVFGRKPLDAATVNNIYAVTPVISESAWEQDRLKLISSIVLDRQSGKVSRFPSGTTYNWTDFVPNTKASEIVYQASAYFQGNTCINIDAPIRITGPAGVGSDGNGVEFAYCVSDSEEVSDGLPTFYPSHRHFDSSGGWYDTAGECPISPTNPYQFVRQRQGQYTSEDDWYWVYRGNRYGKSTNPNSDILDVSQAPSGWNYGWSEPMLWSSWGNDGVDGDGVQYIYLRLTEEEFQFVNADPSRWNFEGGVSDSDPGDITDPTNPNNPNNFQYYYSLDNPVYNYPDLVGAQDLSLRLTGVKGHYTIINGEGQKIVDNEPFTISFYITLSDSDINTDKVNTKACSQNYTYSGPYLPQNELGLGSISGTVNFTRDKLIEEATSYFVYYLEGNANSNTPIVSSLCPEGVNPTIVMYDGTSEIPVTAPTISGYRINGESSDTVTPSHTTISFYYTKI